MGQEFFVKSDTLESKVRELLPSQGGLGAGFDLSATTQIVPIIDLTESAEGSNVRADLQSALSLNDITGFQVVNSTSTLINNTGYFRVFGALTGTNPTSGSSKQAIFEVTDGVTTKQLFNYSFNPGTNAVTTVSNFDFVVFLASGQSLTCNTNSSGLALVGCTKQLASIDGTLTTPS